MQKINRIKSCVVILMGIQALSTSRATAGTIYLYLENKTNNTIVAQRYDGILSPYHRRSDRPLIEIKPHQTIEVGTIAGNFYPINGPKDWDVVGLTLAKLQSKLYLKASSQGESVNNVGLISSTEDYHRTGLNWDVSLDPSTLDAGNKEDVPGSRRELILKQNKNCNANSCLRYKITAIKQTHPVRAPDIYYTIEEIH